MHALLPRYTKGMQEIWSLKDINFEIKRGESVAIIGRNGGGKSTLLEILTGTLTPTTGNVKVNGRVSALLELGSGFNLEYTGRDNVMLNGLLLGLERDEILSRFDEIEEFAEIGVAIDRPVKTYSSGMIMRLAFAVQVLCDPEILIIDEALSVGDFFFQQKCLSHIKELCSKGVTLLFVSHDMGTVRDLCPRVAYLKQGELIFDGASNAGISLFFNEKLEKSNIQSPERIIESGSGIKKCNNYLNEITKDAVWVSSTSDFPGKLVAVAVYGEDNVPKMSFRMCEKMIVRVLFKPDVRFANQISFEIRDKFGVVITSTGSLQLGVAYPRADSQNRLFELNISLFIEAGEYSLYVNLGYETNRNRGRILDESGVIGPISVNWDYENDLAPFLGKAGLPASAIYKDVLLLE